MGTPVSLAGKLVYVVDDEVCIADSLSLILSHAGFVVHTFYDAPTAFEHAQAEKPDIVLSDVMMPKMDGFTLATKVREQNPHCIVLLISGNACTPGLLSEWPGGTAWEILPKPISPRLIIRKIEAMYTAKQDANETSPCSK